MDAASDSARGRMISANGIELWVDAEASDAENVVVLVSGADSAGFRWGRTLVDPLLDAGFGVVRFDQRGCGRSGLAGSGPYGLEDLAADLLGILDQLEVPQCHLVGRSMGGMIGQVVTLEAPERVASLTLLATTPGASDEQLPGPEDSFVEAMTHRLLTGAPSDSDQLIEWLADLPDLMSSPSHPPDRRLELERARAEVARGWVPASRHGEAVFSSPSRLGRLAEIAVPTMVVHGTVDPVLPVAHGRALALGIDGALLVEVEGLGHAFPDSVFADLAPALIHHLRAAVEFGGDSGD